MEKKYKIISEIKNKLQEGNQAQIKNILKSTEETQRNNEEDKNERKYN